MAVDMTVPMIKWNKRAYPEGETDYEWVEENSPDIFEGKRVVVFALPGAFTPHVVVHIYLDTKQSMMKSLLKM